MSNRVYPRTVWVLMPSFKPVEVEVVKKYEVWSGRDAGDITAKGKRYELGEMFPSKEAVIFAGRRDVARAQADINKRQENLDQRIAELNKAEGK